MIPKLKVTPLRRKWDPYDLLSSLNSYTIPNHAELLKDRRIKLWKDTYAEYDARCLQAEIKRRGVVTTREAKAFLAAWASDEERHTGGFVRLMQLAANVTPEDCWRDLDDRPHDFSIIDEYLRDEFSVLVTIAFDEIVTCHAYHADRVFYNALGNRLYVEWWRNLIADEAVHFRNAVSVLRTCNSHQLQNVEHIVDSLLAVREPEEYLGTFVLDHFGEDYTMELLTRCRNILLSAVQRTQFH